MIPSALRFRDRHWGLALIAAWLLLISAPKWPHLMPASHWFEVRSVHVFDTFEGFPPKMAVDRTIHRPFQGDWIATVMRQESGGRFTTYCPAPGSSDYRPTASLPENLDLNWWTWPRKCDLPPGVYRINTLWVLNLPEDATKYVRVTSNEFKVRAK